MADIAPEEELFDTQTDPHEIRNLADSDKPEHREALAAPARERSTPGSRRPATAATWPEPPEVVAPFEKEMHDWFGTPAWVTP